MIGQNDVPAEVFDLEAAAAFNAFSGVGVICLTLSYAAPIACSLLGGRKQMVDGQFYLGKLGLFCNIVALGKFDLHR